MSTTRPLKIVLHRQPQFDAFNETRKTRQYWATIVGGNGEIIMTGELVKSLASLRKTIGHLVSGFLTGHYVIVDRTKQK